MNTSDVMATRFSQQIEAFFGSGRCFLLSKGRVALYAGLRAMDLPAGSKILTPGYTCMALPSAIQFAGHKCVYVDIDPTTYNIDPALLDRPQYSDCAAIIIQHTYGIPCNIATILPWARVRDIPVLEDCCHSFGSRVDGQLCGTLGEFAFMSGQWNKPFSTGLGGILLVNNEQLAQRVATLMATESHHPGALERLRLRLQLAAFDVLMRPRIVARVTQLYRILGRLGLMTGSASNDELGGRKPDDYLSTMAPCQSRRGAKEMSRIEQNISHRLELTRFYQERLPSIGFQPLGVAGVGGLPLLRYPVRVANKSELLEMAAKKGVELGSWFEVPLHPKETPQERYGYTWGMCPVAEEACHQTVNLPTHRRIDMKTGERTLTFLQKYGKPA